MKNTNNEIMWDSELQEIERDIFLDSLKSQAYIEKTLKDITAIEPARLIAESKSVSYRIPFKVKWQRLKNKMFKTLR